MLVLASQSPRRSEILRQAGIPFTVRPVEVDETPLAGESPRAYVERLALAKALAAPAGPQETVLAADTTVTIDGALLGKPADAADARRMLALLSEEANTLGAELGKPLLEQLAFLQMVASRRMRGQAAFLSVNAGSIQFMPGDLLHVRTVDDQFFLCDPHRQQLADALPGHGIEVLLIGDVALRIDSAIENLGCIVGLGGQAQQMRLLFLE